MDRHEEACPLRPEMHARLLAFMRHWAEDGVALSRAMYIDLASDYHEEHGVSLTSPALIERAYGSWQAFAASCGLSYTPKMYHPQRSQLGLDPCHMPGSVMADDTHYHDPSCLRCEPLTRPVRRWDWRIKAWTVVGLQTTWMVR
jgi:hypothetical protein